MAEGVTTVHPPTNIDPTGGGARLVQELAIRAMHGDEHAYADLHHEMIGPFTRFFAKRVGGNVGLAEELAHETISEALRGLMAGTYQPDRAWFVTFTYGISRKVRLRHLRRESRRRECPLSEVKVEDSGHIDNCLAGKEDQPPPLEKIEAMLACLQVDGTPFSLTAEERFVVMGRAGQKTYQTLARELSHSLDTVHRRMRRGIEKLKKCMEAKGYT